MLFDFKKKINKDVDELNEHVSWVYINNYLYLQGRG